MDARATLTERILELHPTFFRCLLAGQTSAWLTVDLTMPQLKALLVVVGVGRATGRQLAKGLGVSLSTVTGIVDRLASHGFVSRAEDPEDRRITRVEATATGRQLVQQLYVYRRERLRRLLDRLELDQLRTVESAIEYLTAAAAHEDGVAGFHELLTQAVATPGTVGPLAQEVAS